MYRRILLMVTVFVFVTGIPYLFAEKPLTIITEDWPPYNYMKKGEIRGFSTEIVQAIMDELNIDNKIKLLPGARGERMLAEKQGIMSFSLFRTSSREKLYKWVGPISEEAIYFYKKKGNPLAVMTLEDAKKVKIVSCPHKGLIFSTLKENGFDNLDLTANHESIIKKLLVGRTDLSVHAPKLGVKYWLKKIELPTDSLEQTPVKLLEFPLYIACTKDIHDNVIQKWQKALDKIRASGKYKQIYMKYME